MSESPGGSESSFHGQDPMQYSDDEDEGKEGYKVGGYHAVKVRHKCKNAFFAGAEVVAGEQYRTRKNRTQLYPFGRLGRWISRCRKLGDSCFAYGFDALCGKYEVFP